MRTIISKTFSSNSSPLYPKKSNHFQWMTLKKHDSANKPTKTPKTLNSNHNNHSEEETEEEEVEILAFSASSSFNENLLQNPTRTPYSSSRQLSKKKSPSALAGETISKLRSTLFTIINNRIRNKQGGLGPCVIGTIYGRRRGKVHLSFQVDPKSPPALLVELETQTSTLVKEMASGLVRIALECHRSVPDQDKKKLSSNTTSATRKLLEEPIWRAYCNGKKCGYATHKDCGPLDWRLFKAVEPVSVGAGVLPSEKDENGENGESEGDVMYMRARFERVVGSKDSEAFYMLNPDGNGGPELNGLRCVWLVGNWCEGIVKLT
ncbi:hypothetical protein LUZ60_012800 [Juncus effusus]|nr:hypothetical protein LUZ60_012800 [Juncus effusus]